MFSVADWFAVTVTASADPNAPADEGVPTGHWLSVPGTNAHMRL